MFQSWLAIILIVQGFFYFESTTFVLCFEGGFLYLEWDELDAVFGLGKGTDGDSEETAQV